MLSRFKSDSGSAVADFVLLVVPASLLMLPLIELLGIYQAAIVKEQVSYDIARYAALADVQSSQAEDYRALRDSTSSLVIDRTAGSCSMLVSTEITTRVTLWPELIRIPIQGRATCEN